MSGVEYNALAEGTFISPYPKTLWGFFTMFFWVFSEPYYYPILLGFFTLPFIFLIRKLNLIQRNKKLIIFLFIYIFCFFGLWFFMGSQVIRYAMNGQVVLMILTAVILGAFLKKILTKIRLAWVIICLIFVSIPLISTLARYENNYFIETKKIQLEYLFGLKNKYEFFRFQNLEEDFLISMYINENLRNKKIINNLCMDQGNFFLNYGNQFVSLRYLAIEENKDTWHQLLEHLKKNNIDYLLFDWQEKERNFYWRSGSCTPDWRDYKDRILPLEELIKEHSEIIFLDSKGRIELYKINISK
ncbi:MAG TPA: hypothetical protein VMZ91_04875 [Candidatus Paceibacterota bacterium]|nr:hypothetical protein [Candidatus Paceibacterota bacterium]